jgi:Flp pilus assembly protein TadD
MARLGRLNEAEAAFRVAVRLEPTNVTMFVNLATCLHQQGRPVDVEEWARQAIHLDPNVAEAHRLLGVSLDLRNRLDQAEACFREALRLDPRLADAHFGLGRIMVRREQHAESESAFREAVRLNPKAAYAWGALGATLDRLNRPKEAVDAHRKAVELEPNSADRHNNLGVALAAADCPEEAETSYREAVRLDAKSASAWSNLGNALRVQDRLEEAEASLKTALQLVPDYPEAHNNIGIVLVQAGRIEEGLDHYDEAIRLRPEYPEAHMNRSLTWLSLGDFDRGWPEYEWRLKVRAKPTQPDPVPRWDGSDLNGRTLLIGAEQGLGDSIHFLRYAALATTRGGTVIFDCPPPLATLARSCPGICEVIPRGADLPRSDFQIPLLSLPGLFGGHSATGLPVVPYLKADPVRAAHWRANLENSNELRVGIAWQGSTAHKGDRLRSVKMTRFAPLAAIPGVRLYSLQRGFGSEQLSDESTRSMGVIDLGTRFDDDMADVAAAMESLDLIVTVDTALAHLAGAMGRPVWVAVPFAADWRWLRDNEDTPWYPTMRLFRQSRRGDWDGVFGRLGAAVAGSARAKAEGRWNASLGITQV